jgi:hypothetical protein
MLSRYVFDDVLELTTPIRLKNGLKGYISGRCWNVRRGVEEYDAMLEGNQMIRGLVAHDFEVTGQPRLDRVRAA